MAPRLVSLMSSPGLFRVPAQICTWPDIVHRSSVCLAGCTWLAINLLVIRAVVPLFCRQAGRASERPTDEDVKWAYLHARQPNRPEISIHHRGKHTTRFTWLKLTGTAGDGCCCFRCLSRRTEMFCIILQSRHQNRVCVCVCVVVLPVVA